jgi:L-asparaginase II
MGVSTKSYADADSPVQRRVMELLSDMGECDLSSASRGTDGCGIPVIAMPLEAIALAMARLGKPEKLSKARSAAATRIIASMTNYPHLVAGKARFATETMEKNPSSFVIKGGAEGVYAASIPPLGLGLAVKIDDGAKRAAETAMATLISRFSAANGQVCIGLEPYLERRIYNAAGDPVGVIRAADEWMH